MGLIYILDDTTQNGFGSYSSLRFHRRGINVRANNVAAAVVAFCDADCRSSDTSPDKMAEAVLDGSARDSITSSIIVTGIEMAETGNRTRTGGVTV